MHPVSACVASPSMYNSRLQPDELPFVAGALVKRVQEFQAGRAAGREALASLGVTNASILVGRNREPVWPAGVVGSITHCVDFCGAVVCKEDTVKAIGIDAEPLFSVSPEVESIVCTDEEISMARALPISSKVDWLTIIFCAKEAFYKCQFGITGFLLDFKDVSLTFCSNSQGTSGEFEVILKNGFANERCFASNLSGRWRQSETHIFAGLSVLQ